MASRQPTRILINFDEEEVGTRGSGGLGPLSPGAQEELPIHALAATLPGTRRPAPGRVLALAPALPACPSGAAGAPARGPQVWQGAEGDRPASEAHRGAGQLGQGGPRPAAGTGRSAAGAAPPRRRPRASSVAAQPRRVARGAAQWPHATALAAVESSGSRSEIRAGARGRSLGPAPRPLAQAESPTPAQRQPADQSSCALKIVPTEIALALEIARAL